MKIIGLIISFIGIASLAVGQKTVKIQLNHLLESENLSEDVVGTNNLSDTYILERVEYYISEISILHDGSQEIKIPDLWVLVDGFDQVTEIDLGNHLIDQIEGVSFYVGVDPDHNHLDPVLWPADHPLAPQAPSMHWGWAAGYRFIALEGYGGPNYNQRIEVHGLGDGNYYKTQIRHQGVEMNNEVTISIDADYTKAFHDISVNGGLVVHAENAEAQFCLQNFSSRVFTANTSTTSIVDPIYHYSKVYPNPTRGEIQFLGFEILDDDILVVSDIQGRLLRKMEGQNFKSGIFLNTKGQLVIRILRGDQTIFSDQINVVK